MSYTTHCKHQHKSGFEEINVETNSYKQWSTIVVSYQQEGHRLKAAERNMFESIVPELSSKQGYVSLQRLCDKQSCKSKLYLYKHLEMMGKAPQASQRSDQGVLCSEPYIRSRKWRQGNRENARARCLCSFKCQLEATSVTDTADGERWIHSSIIYASNFICPKKYFREGCALASWLKGKFGSLPTSSSTTL